MRRLLASSLLLMFAIVLVSAPAAASLTSGLPACCRAGGAHHCAGVPSNSPGPGFASQPAACPYSQPVLVTHAARPESRAAVSDSLEAHPFIMEFVPQPPPAQSENRHADRGPPLASR